MQPIDRLAALSDPTRRRVFEMVLRRPSPVGRLASALPVSRPAVSQHLRVLLDAGLVVAEREGASRVYRADAAGLAELRAWFEELWDDALDAFEAAARKEHEMRSTTEAIAPVVKTRTVPLPVEAAFDLFTGRIGEWWPTATHSIAGDDVAEVRFEGRVGGRIVEVARDGTECSWGEVMAWNPPRRFVVSWHAAPEPKAASVLEVRFRPVADGTELHLEHRGWEEHGAEGQPLRDRYEPGWDFVLDRFVAAAGRPA
jgi:DNA-binding transcriptional ArsR family regulator